MRKIRDVLRLKYEKGLSNRTIGSSLGIAHSTVGAYLRRAQKAGVEWPLPEDWDDGDLEEALFPPTAPSNVPRPLPDWGVVHRELSRHKGVTLRLLWLEYKTAHPDGFEYSRFCERYKAWRGELDVVLRQPYQGGEKGLVDHAGPAQPIVDLDTAEVREARVFVGTLGASNYTFVDLTWTRSLADWIRSHVRMFEFWGGVPELVIPDNEGAGVRSASLYEPDVNPTYHDLALHYGTTVLPTRPNAPRDKAKAEAAVQAVEREVMAPLRNHTFFSLAEGRKAYRDRLDRLNNRPFRKLEGSRQSLFEELDRPNLKPLPTKRFEFGTWKKARVHVDYHVQVENHYYSVPHPLRRKEVDVRVTDRTVEIFHKGQRMASHARSYRKGRHTTQPDHMPSHHRKHLEWSPERFIRWAGDVGPETAAFVAELLERRRHPEQGYRSCLGLMDLAKSYPPERMEAACHRARRIKGHSYRSVSSILQSNLDQEPLQREFPLPLPSRHEHVRGADYYRTAGTPDTTDTTDTKDTTNTVDTVDTVASTVSEASSQKEGD
jgi:transposase